MRPTTVPKEWKQLIDAASERAYEEGKGEGGVEYICSALSIAHSTLYRASRGQIALGADIEARLQVLCDLLGVDNPYAKTKPWSKDLVPLRLLGDELERGLPIAERVIKRLRDMYPEAQLVRLAESDGTPESIMRAVLRLLEDA